MGCKAILLLATMKTDIFNLQYALIGLSLNYHNFRFCSFQTQLEKVRTRFIRKLEKKKIRKASLAISLPYISEDVQTSHIYSVIPCEVLIDGSDRINYGWSQAPSMVCIQMKAKHFADVAHGG